MTGSPAIPHEEFAARRERARAAARVQGWDGLLVCSRGGGTLDRYADILYLTNFYASFPYIPDLTGSWSGRGHAFLVLPVDGDPILIVDAAPGPEVAMPSGRIRIEEDVVRGVVDAVASAGLSATRLGLVGADALPCSMHASLTTELPELSLVDAQTAVARLRRVKSPGEIEKLAAASQLGSRTLDAMMDAAEPGRLHGEIVAAGMQALLPAGGMLYNSFMASGRGGAEPKQIAAAFPTWKSREPLEEGDWFRVGLSGVLDGYVFDLARSRAIGAPEQRQVRLFEAAIEVVETTAAAMRPGATAHEVASAGLDAQRRLGFDLLGAFSGLGHGVGLGWDEPWLTLGNEQTLEEDMVLSVERTITEDGFLGDFEETVVVTRDGTRKLTDAVIRRW